MSLLSNIPGLCLEGHTNEAKGSIQAELTLSPRLHVKPLLTAIRAIREAVTVLVSLKSRQEVLANMICPLAVSSDLTRV